MDDWKNTVFFVKKYWKNPNIVTYFYWKNRYFTEEKYWKNRLFVQNTENILFKTPKMVAHFPYLYFI